MAKRSKPGSPSPNPKPVPTANPYLAAFLAWIVPGSGHAFVGRRGRGAIFFAVVTTAILVGVALDGRLPWQFSNAPLTTLATLGVLGSGLPCLVLRLGMDYTGDMTAAGYEYGGAFILTAGLMNLLLVLDAWDIALGREASIAEDDKGIEDSAEEQS